MKILKNKVLQFENKVKKYLNNKIGKINVKHKSQLDLVPFQVLTSAYSQNQLVATPTGVAPGILGIRYAGWEKGVLLSFCVGVKGFGVCGR